MPVRYRKFGSSDMLVSEACLGTMMWGSFTTDEKEVFAQLDLSVQKGCNFIDTAELYPVPASPAYANLSEVLLGKWLKQRLADSSLKYPDGRALARENIYIATKVIGDLRFMGEGAWKNLRSIVAGREDPCGERPMKSDGAEIDFEKPDPAYASDFSGAQLLKACRASCERMSVDYIDLYQLHWPDRYAPGFGKVEYKPENEFHAEAGKAKGQDFKDGELYDRSKPEHFDKIVLAVKSLLDAKLIRHWGLSNETAFGIMAYCAACDRHSVPRPVSVQNDVSLLNRGFECDIAEVCRHFNIAGLPYGALAGGTLSGKYNNRDSETGKWYADASYDPKTGKLDVGRSGNELETAPEAVLNSRHEKKPEFQPRYHNPKALEATRRYTALGEKHGLKTIEIAIGWMKSRWWNTSVITGSTTAAQLEEYMDAFNVDLSPEVLEEIDRIHGEARNPNVVEQ